MCLYPTLIINPKYKPNKKNGGNPPPLTDERIKYVPIGCQDCMECRKQKTNQWKTRLLEEIKTDNTGKFIGFTFSNESIKKLSQHEKIRELQGYDKDNAIATLAIRYFLERWRKQFAKSLKHFLITEIGHNGTENIHLHGIIWTTQSMEKIASIWAYGHLLKGRYNQKTGQYINYVNQKSINYIIKYITKKDELHKLYKPIILTSPRIGNKYTSSYDARRNAYNDKSTKEYYKTPSGTKVSLPIYYRNKLYTEQQREQLWIQRIEKNERWVCGERVDITENQNEYYKLLKYYQSINIRLGYGNGQKTWEQHQYETQCRNLKILERINKPTPKKCGHQHLATTTTMDTG